MANDTDMSSWNDLLHSSTKLIEQSSPSPQFPPLQRNLDQLEALSKKLKAKTQRTEAPSQSIAATRLLAREGINAEQLSRDLKSFELKATYEDVFPSEATSVEEYLQQVHEMAMVSAVQEAQKDNLKSFSDHMMKVLAEDWKNERRNFLQSLSRISILPKTQTDSSIVGTRSGQLVPGSLASSPHITCAPSLELVALANKPILERKATVYAEAVKNLNIARESGSQYKPASAFKSAYESLGLDASGGKSVSMQKMWLLIQAMTGEVSDVPRGVSKKMAMVIGARRHLEWGHEKYIMDTIQSHPAQAALGGVVGNLQRVHAFLRIRLRDYGVLDFDAGDSRRQPPVDTTWQQIYFSLRTGYYDEARNIAMSSRAAHQLVPLRKRENSCLPNEKMANDTDMSSWNDLLHSSTKLIEQSSPSPQFPPLQRNLDQLEALSKKLKAKTQRTEAPSQSIAATRLLAREGINAEQLSRDLKSFELKATYEDVFPSEATSVEEYLQQVHEMAMVSAVQEAQKDNLKSFSDHMMKVLAEDWKNERRNFLQSLSRISILPKTQTDSSIVGTRSGQLVPGSLASSPHITCAPSLELIALANKPILERKATVYAEAVKNLNIARESGSQYKPASAFKSAYESLGLDASGGKSVSMQKMWLLIQAMMGEVSDVPRGVSKKMAMVIGARRHLEWGHEKYIMDTIQSHPAQAALGGVVGNLQRVHAFLRIRLRDYGVLDFDAGDSRRQPPVDTTWQQIYFCLRTGYYDEARNIAMSSRAAHQLVPLLSDWITSGGMVSAETAATASEECEKILRMGDRVGRNAYDRKKLPLYAIISGSRRHIDRLLRDMPSLFNTIEDFMWFNLSAVRDCPSGPSAVILNEGMVPYSLDDLQVYLNKFEPSYYTKNGKDPLVYPYVLLLSIQLLPAILYLSKETGNEGFSVDVVHISIALEDHGVLSEGSGLGHRLGVMDAFAETASIIRQYGSIYSRSGNLSMALEYYAQAAAAVGGGHLSWTGRASVDQQRQKSIMLKQLLMELLLQDGGVYLLLGTRGSGEEGELRRFLTDASMREQFLLEAAHHCEEAGHYDKSIEILKRVGAFSMALDTINKCLSEAVCALSRGRSDGESETSGLIHSGNEILETYKYFPEVSYQEREHVMEQQTVLRQLEAILSIHKLAGIGHYLDALREVTKLPFLPLDPRAPDTTADGFDNLSPHVQACVPDLLKTALICLDNTNDSDGSLRALRRKIKIFLANNMKRNWPHYLYEKVAQTL